MHFVLGLEILILEFIVWECRFTYFCKVALEHMVKLRKQADVIHLHNWQTAAVAPMFWDLYAHQVQTKPNKGLQYIITQKICHWYLLQGLQNTRLLLTCHNFKYQVYVHFLFYFKEFTVWLMECNKNLEACFILSSCIVTVLTGTT